MSGDGSQPLLLPFPRSLRRGEGWNAKPGDPRVVVDPAAELGFGGPEAYRLEITPSGPPGIAARDAAGARHARATLAQLRRQYGERVPCMTVEDAPAFPTRGVMLDVSRDRVPTMEHLRSTVETLAELKFNHLQLYTEHTFAYAGHDEVWEGWSPITPEEVRTLDAHCRRHGIALAANQNCFGHLASWLRHPRYAPLAETHGEWVFENAGRQFPRKGPFSLCPTDPASLALVDDLLGQLLPCFESPLVNINCDETFDVGCGRSAAAVRERGRAAVYFEFVNRIAAAARRHGKRPMLWADIALSQPESLVMFPEGAIALAWGYEPDTPFADWCGTLRSRGIDTWVCPGTSSWRSITGRTRERAANLKSAALAGSLSSATGFLVTEWGDSGHHQQWPVTIHGLAHAAERAWRGAGGIYDPAAGALHALNASDARLGPWLDRLGNADAALRLLTGPSAADGQPTALRNSSALFVDLHTPLERKWDARGPMLWERAAEEIEELAATKPRVSDALMDAEIEHTLGVARLAARRAVVRRGGGGGRRELGEAARAVRAEHRRLWLVRSRPGGLEHSTTYYDRVIADLETRA